MMRVPRVRTCRRRTCRGLWCAWIATARPGAISCRLNMRAAGGPWHMAPWCVHWLGATKGTACRHDRRCDEQFTYQGRTITVRGWRDVVRSDQKVVTDQATFTIWVYADPLYQAPFVLDPTDGQPGDHLPTDLDRWPVEEVPLVCKQLLGLQASSCLPTGRGSGSPNWASLPPTSWRIWRRSYPPSPRLLGSPTAAHALPLAVCVGQAGFPNAYPLAGRIREKL